jgi:pimeloyl-ACP methyl ester carboxylesterase
MNNLPSSTIETHMESFANGLVVRVDEQGSGRPILVLHGGGGLPTVAGLAKALAQNARVLTPTHPGFGGQPRPEWFDTMDDLALTYLDLLERLDLHNVIVVGSSVGGWIASAMAVYNSSRLAGIVLLDGVGIQVEGHPVVNISDMSPDEVSVLSFHNPAAFRIDPSTLSPEQIAIAVANKKTLYTYDKQGGDPRLKRRLSYVHIPALVLWGESDRISDPEYGRAYAQAFPNAHFQIISEAGHLPHFEQPARVLNLIQDFVNGAASQNRKG